MLCGSQMPTQFSTRFSYQFSQWKPIETFTCENQIENEPQVLMYEWKPIQIYTYIYIWKIGDVLS
jgi:hypothetical protein